MSSVLENTEDLLSVVATGVADYSKAKGGSRCLGTLVMRARYISPLLGGSGNISCLLGCLRAVKVLDG